MHAQKLLHKLLKKSAVIGHEKRLNCLLRAVESVVHQGKLSLTSIGRHLKGTAKVKHKIKSVDQLLGNEQLMNEREGIYDLLSATLLGGLKEMLVVIDWSPCGSHAYQLLKASVVFQGRTMTLYEEVHPEKKLGNFKVHQQFLSRLKAKIPAGCPVIVATDAGFRTEWFELVLELGWDFLGRVRSNMLFQAEGSEAWISCLSLYSKAKEGVKVVGNVLLAKARSLPCTMYIYYEKKANKEKNKVKRKILSGKKEKDYGRANRECWLLVTSLTGGLKSANQMIYRYRKRMRIEHEFRDTKNSEWGIGLEYSRTKEVARLQILLLIGYLALFLLWVIGLAAEEKKLQYHYQANTIKKYRVLSLVYLGLQIILHDPDCINELDIINSFNKVRKLCI